ncbi:pantoate-beta-alanine ligase [Balamuthia mandrillaris]
MKIASNLGAFRKLRFSSPMLEKQSVGFVPTMGALHPGHLSLVRMAKSRCDAVVVSIFVNPTQFAPHEDLKAYPRTFKEDTELLATEGVDLVLAPFDQDELYPPDFSTFVEVESINQTIEAQRRPHHFRGVATILTKLFHVVQPRYAFFGQKDAIQCILARRLVRDLNFLSGSAAEGGHNNLEVVVGATVREEDGLAMSSRNRYLSPEERAKAPIIYRALQESKERYLHGQMLSARELKEHAWSVMESVEGVKVDYVSVVDAMLGKELNGELRPESLSEEGAILSAAMVLGRTRLIDNVILPPLKM